METSAYKRKSILSVIFLTLVMTLSAQIDCSIKNFNTENGLLQNIVTGLSLDTDGFLWIGTQNGLVRYDGSRFRTFVFDSSGNNSPANHILYITNIAREKRILARAKNGVVYQIKKGKPELYDAGLKKTNYHYDVRGNFPSLSAFDTFNQEGLELYRKYNWNRDGARLLLINETDFLVNSDNENVLLFYKNKAGQKIIQTSFEADVMMKVGGHGIVSDKNSGLHLFDTVNYTFRKLKIECNEMIKENMPGSAWFSDPSSGNSFCFLNSVFYQLQFDAEKMLIRLAPQFTINDKRHFWKGIAYDSLSATFFLSTLSEGLFQVKQKRIRTFSLSEKLPGNLKPETIINYSIAKTTDSTAIVPAGFQFKSSKSGITISPVHNLLSNRETIGFSENGLLICASIDKLLYRSPDDKYSLSRLYNDSFTTINNNKYIHLVYPEGDSVWVGSNSGVYCVSRRKVSKVMAPPGNQPSPYFSLRLFYRHSPATAYISNLNGLYKLSTIAPFNIDTLQAMNGKQVRHITPYKDLLIVSVYKSGIYILKNNVFYKVPADLPEIIKCHSTYIDKNGFIWIPTDRGLFKSTVISLVEAALYPGTVPYFFRYDKSDGIDNMEFNGGGTPGYAVLKDGLVLYPSMGGVVAIRPADFNDNVSGNPVLIEKIIIDEEEKPVHGDSIHLRADYKHLAIELVVPGFGSSHNLWLEYNFDNKGWVKIRDTDNPRIALININSGQHRLVIRQRTGFDKDSYYYKTVFISRGKSIYETIWFYLALLAAVSLLIWVFSEWKAQQINRKRIELQKLVNEQTAELSKAVDLKDMLISIISHDMITPLRHISLVSDILGKGLETDPQKATDALLDIKSTSDKLLSESMSIINWIKYNNEKIHVEKKSINLYDLIDETMSLYAGIASNKNIVLLNEAPRSIFIKADYTILKTILNNIIANAIKYSLSGQIKIFTDTQSVAAKIILKLSDTGAGMNAETLGAIQEILKGNLQALKTTNKIITGLGYILIAELVKIHDLSVSVDSELNKGTTVTVVIDNPD